mmetsp:Transcript_6532/g.15846  ORF Transcript_6532/g.15846 Transcript_6532/m.15846 type:complete len:98 (-) Transcript_6532:511-804(-)
MYPSSLTTTSRNGLVSEARWNGWRHYLICSWKTTGATITEVAPITEVASITEVEIAMEIATDVADPEALREISNNLARSFRGDQRWVPHTMVWSQVS